ncbi:hypothetical protein MAA_03108 [Metarhizium robertsii ARSEF 23]|uniref:DUF3176 domain protein n=1 Tax=Metarhizium robertsii (strain ARSEF 23 / ATCC MYA-3075) TaxID=655844 RepID=E9ER66_METRA|nr:uncharacterized protein MAA_03108 [Metarhizium robertsii ARSEF 23]EFZ01879.2 hypothetical protein MAA_03108 [Metarhizium robertsii ARSEF 23]
MGSLKENSSDTTTKSYRLSSRVNSLTYERLHKGRQLRGLLGACLSRWLMTLVLCAAIYAVLWRYSTNMTMPKNRKKDFNALIVGLSILLSLNLASSLKHMVATLRWWVLSLNEWRPREVDLILQGENISRMVRLLHLSERYTLRFYVIVWVLINVAAQIGLACLGLTYNVNGADKIVPMVNGIVSIPDLTSIQTNRVLSQQQQTPSQLQALNALRFTANNYGMSALASGVNYPAQFSPPTPGTLYNPDTIAIACDNTTACYSTFYESTPENLSYYFMAATNRSISTTSKCQAFRVTRGGNGDFDNITIADVNTTSFTLPTKNGPDQTTFIVDPANDQHVGWSVVSAFEASNTNPWFYKCNISVGPVVNAVLGVHKLGDNIKLMAPAAIALQGYGASMGTNLSNHIQFQSYPAESLYGSPAGGDTVLMGVITSIFASGVIWTTTQANTNIKATGRLPVQGITLDINNWAYVHLILGLIMGLQLLFALISIALSNRVMVRDHSHFGEAALLRSTMYDLSYRAVMANEREIAKLFPKSATIRYVREENGTYYLRVSN